MNQPTELIYLLDKSGSMESLQEPAIAAFNEFVKNQQEVPGAARLTLITFNDRHQTVINALPLLEVPFLIGPDYQPTGGTALLDAIGHAIKNTAQRLKEEHVGSTARGKVIFAIFTDGIENCSTHFTQAHLGDLITFHREQFGWEFLFLAANQDAIASACALNMDRSSSGNVAFNPQGIHSSSFSLHRKIRSMRMKADGQMDGQATEDEAKTMEEIIQEENVLMEKWWPSEPTKGQI
jgi:hypothetical protein